MIFSLDKYNSFWTGFPTYNPFCSQQAERSSKEEKKKEIWLCLWPAYISKEQNP